MKITSHRFLTTALLIPAILILAVSFLAPLGRLVLISFSSPKGLFYAYSQLFEDEIFATVFLNTTTIAIIVTLLAIVIAYPVAFALTKVSKGWHAILLACVLLPLWISVLVRTFAWMVLLERNGPVNTLLVSSGILEKPISLLFNHASVGIGMLHVLLPYAVLPMYAALVQIEPNLLRASEGLGASRTTTFLKVLLPLSLKGIATAATFTFLLSLGFFVTPALLGGASSLTLSMLIDSFVSDRLNWPLASAASVILLISALLVVAISKRFIALTSFARVHQ